MKTEINGIPRRIRLDFEAGGTVSGYYLKIKGLI